MREGKRVLLDPARGVIFVALTVICLSLFLYSVLDTVGADAFRNLRLSASYAETLTEKWKTEDIRTIRLHAEEESANTWDYYMYLRGRNAFAIRYMTRKEAYGALAEYPELKRLTDTGQLNRYRNLAGSCERAREEVLASAEHIANYAGYLEKVAIQAEKQSATSIFGREGSFSLRNLKKTAADFKPLRNSRVILGNDRAITKWLSFRLADLFHFLAIILVVLSFLEERKTGLWNLVRAAPGGRRPLALRRVGILFAASGLFVLLFHGLTLLLSFGLFGGASDLLRPLQSVPVFCTCTIQVSICIWLLLYGTAKLICGAFLGIFVWAVVGSFENAAHAVPTLGAILGGEYILYHFLPVQSAFNVFKYLNIFSYIHTADLYTEYLNIDLFGYPIGNRMLTFGALVPAAFLLLVFNLRREELKYPDTGLKTGERWSLSYAVVKWKIPGYAILSVFEFCKTFVYEHALLLLILMLLASRSLTFFSWSPEREDRWYKAYLADIEGELSDTDAYFLNAREHAGGASEESEMLDALKRLEEETRRVRCTAKAGGYRPWMVDEGVYDVVYGDISYDRQRLNSAIAILFISLLCCGLTAFEREMHVTDLLRSMPRGRLMLFWQKVLLAIVLCTAVFGMVFIRELITFLHTQNPVTLDAPIRNLYTFSKFPVNTTIGGYLALLYTIRYVMLLCVGFIAMLIGDLSDSIRSAFFRSVVLLFLPGILFALGVSAMRYVSPVVPVAASEILRKTGDGDVVHLFPFFILLYFGISAIYLYYCHWVKGE